MKRFFLAKATEKKKGELYIYEDIGGGYFGGVSAAQFKDQLAEVRDVDVLDIYINSYGGEVFDGVSIYNQLLRLKARKIVHIDGIAASIASIIAMAGDEIQIAANAQMMIHDAWGVTIGNATDMEKAAAELKTINKTLVDTYAARSKSKPADIAQWMTDESWMTAQECIDRGFADKISAESTVVEENRAAPSPLVAHFKNAPEPLKREARSAKVRMASMAMRIDKVRRARAAATA